MDSKWILKGLVESVFVVGSILMALAVDEWSQNKEYAELADQSLGIFESEIRRNQTGLEDVTPYHEGIRDFLTQQQADPNGMVEVRSVLEGVAPPVLLNTAWETALATGALTHMELEVVSALSLTYSYQDGFETRARLDRPRFAPSEGLTNGQRREQLQEASQYVFALTQDEAELLAVFGEALAIIAVHRNVTTISSGRRPPTGPGG